MTGPEQCKQVETLPHSRGVMRLGFTVLPGSIPKNLLGRPLWLLTAGPRTAINSCQWTLRTGTGTNIVNW